MNVKFSRIALTAFVAVGLLDGSATAQQVALPRIELMPNIPSNFGVPNWKAKATGYDTLVFDSSTSSTPYAPLIWTDTTHINNSRDTFGLPSYVGSYVQTGGTAHEGVTCMGSVLGATLVGIDKSNQGGKNYVQMEQCYYNSASGEGLVLNNTFTHTGQTFWYEVFPGIVFCQLAYYYPSVVGMSNIMLATADKWYNAEYLMGGSTGTPDFNHTSFNMLTATPVNNGQWTEPDSSAGIGWLQYMAYKKFGQAKYLQGADWGMQYLQNRTTNPYYENLLPFGAYTAARMNAELGRTYDIQKFMNWCFDSSSVSRGAYGVLVGSFGTYDVNGLMGATDSPQYAFAMDTYTMAGALVPLVRYDNRFARAIGKWMLNVANNCKVFYADTVPASNQSGATWAQASQNVIGYEGFRQQASVSSFADSDYANAQGTLVSGTYVDTTKWDATDQVLSEAVVGTHDELDHIWRFPVISGTSSLNLVAYAWIVPGSDADTGFDFSYSASPSGPWTSMFTVNGTTSQPYWHGVSGVTGNVYIRVTDNNRTAGNTSLDQLHVSIMYLGGEKVSLAPYAQGDPTRLGWGNTDYGLYGSGYVGILGGLIQPTNNQYILQLDLLKTDTFHDTAYPSYLYYNPHTSSAWVNIDVGTTPVDLYDSVSNTFLRSNVTGVTNFQVPADSAAVVVLTPAGGTRTFNGNTMSINGVVVDYSGNPSSAVTDWALY